MNGTDKTPALPALNIGSAAQRLLIRARELNAESAHQALLELLSPLPTSDLETEPELVFLLANARWEQGAPDEAAALLSRFAEVFHHRASASVNRRRLNLEGVLLLQSGQLEEAEQRLETASQMSAEAQDSPVLARTLINLGAIAGIRRDLERALMQFQLASVYLERVGELRIKGVAYHNCAVAYREMGRVRDAESAFTRALSCFQVQGTTWERLGVYKERAILHLDMGDATVARFLASRALTLARSLSRPGAAAEPLRVLGMVDRLSGRSESAGTQFQTALEMATDAGNTLLQAEVLEEQGVLSLALGDLAGAARAIRAAADRYRAIGSPVRAERALSRLG